MADSGTENSATGPCRECPYLGRLHGSLGPWQARGKGETLVDRRRTAHRQKSNHLHREVFVVNRIGRIGLRADQTTRLRRRRGDLRLSSLTKPGNNSAWAAGNFLKRAAPRPAEADILTLA